MKRSKITYSVPEIKRMLGIGKTSAYALVKEGYFEKVEVAGEIRVMKDSFDTWFANQSHYSLADTFTGGE